VNKKLNTALFLIAASLVNIILIILCFLLFSFIVHLLIPAPSEGAAGVILILIFFLSFGVSFFIYYKLMKLLSDKIDLETYFHPIFIPKKK